MVLHKKRIALLGLGIALMNCNISSALTQEELYNYVLGTHAERFTETDTMKEYMIKNGITEKEYTEYIAKLSKYNNSKEYLWERVENGSILIDQILFADKTVRNEYDKALKLLEDEHLAYIQVKKNMINSPKTFIDKFKSAMNDSNKLKEATRAKYKRALTEDEEMHLSNKDEVKYALYAGTNGGIVPVPKDYTWDMAIGMIDEGRGYELLNLTEDDIKVYMEFVQKRNSYDKIMATYVKSYSMFQFIHTEVMNSYGIDIFKELTETERNEIYDKSIDGFIFNEKSAKKKILDLLVSKEVLSKEDLIEDEDEDEKGEVDTTNPWQDLQNHLEKEALSNSRIQFLSSLYNNEGINVIFENLLPENIYVKYKDKNINTYIRLSRDEKIKDSLVGRLFELLEKEFGLKVIFSAKKTMVLFENEVSIFDFSFNENEGVEFKRLVKMFNEIGITMYLKPIDFENSDNVDKDDEELIEKVVLNLEDKMVLFELGEEKTISISDVNKLLEVLGVKHIESLDSALIYKDNGIKLTTVLGIRKYKMTIGELEILLNDMDEKVNIQVIKEGV